MAELTETDLHFVVTRVPKDVRKVIKEDGVVLAGGFIRSTIAGERASDIDLFGESAEKLEKVAYRLATQRHGRIHKTPNALTLLASPRIPVQFITRWIFTQPSDAIDSFDFTIAQAAIYFADEKWRSVVAPEFYSDLAARRLNYTAPARHEDAGGSLLRVRKFLTKGYSIQAPSLAKVIARLMQGVEVDGGLDIHNEGALAILLLALLREVDPLVVIDGVDMMDEHEVLEEG